MIHPRSERKRPAFAVDALGQGAKAAAKATWWTATGGLARALTKPTQGAQTRHSRAGRCGLQTREGDAGGPVRLVAPY
ncbi:hypothetical protein CSW63_14135 [Caulobacter sp. FWC26]|nr:hypothetical protein CSW63_14135 [Caulobacter sp. FWC26]